MKAWRPSCALLLTTPIMAPAFISLLALLVESAELFELTVVAGDVPPLLPPATLAVVAVPVPGKVPVEAIDPVVESPDEG